MPTVNEANAHILEIKPYQAGRSAKEIRDIYAVDEVVRLCSNECPFPPGELVREALEREIAEIGRYPYDPAPILKQQLSAVNDIESANISLGAGSSEVLEKVIRAFCMPGENIVVSERAFALYRVLAKAQNAEVIEVKEQNFQHDLEATLAVITLQTKIVFITNPNNPTGSWIRKDPLTDFIERVPANVLVVVDEAYQEYMCEVPEYASAVELAKKHRNVVVVRTFSKAYGMAGLRFGYSVSSQEVAKILNLVRKPFNVSSLSIAAAKAALLDHDHLKKVIDNNRVGMAQMAAAFDAMGISYIDKTANFLTIDIGPKAVEISTTLMEQGIVVRPLLPYCMPNHLRVSIGLPDENRIFLDALQLLLTRTT